MENIPFLKGDIVSKSGKIGKVWKLSEKACHVIYDDGFFEKFHYSPTHHTQSSILILEKHELPKEENQNQ